MQCVTSHPLVGGELRSRKYTMITISAYFSRRGPKREIQSNQASCTHTPSTTDSYVSAEFSFIQFDLCEKTPNRPCERYESSQLPAHPSALQHSLHKYPQMDEVTPALSLEWLD